MFCGKCGKENAEGMKFCKFCGNELTAGKKAEKSKSNDEPWKTMTYAELPEVANKAKKAVENFNFDMDKTKSKISDLWFKFKNKVGIGEPETNGENVYERGKKIVPECISADEGEIPIRQYVVAKLRTVHRLHWAEGRLQVTNKRVIFRAPGRSIGGKTVLQYEFAIDEVAGIEARKEPRLSIAELFFVYWLGAIVGLLFNLFVTKIYSEVPVLGGILAGLFVVGGFVPSFVLHKKFLLKSVTAGASVGCANLLKVIIATNKFGGWLFTMVTILVGIVTILWIITMLLFALRTNLVLTIKTKSASGAVEIRKKKKKGLLGMIFPNSASEKEEYTGFSTVLPMQDTEKSIREIGAMISDIQKLGDYGIEKWKQD